MTSVITPPRQMDRTGVSRKMTTPRCLVAHIAGDQAGLLLIEMHLPESATEKSIRSNVRLLVAGEVEPLEPATVQGSDGEFTVTFFSSAVANTGQLPSEVELQVDTEDGHTEFAPVQILSTIEVTHRLVDPDEGDSAASPLIIYPKNVIIYSVIGIFVGLAIGFLVLIFSGLN